MANQVDSQVKMHMCTSVPQQNLGLGQKDPKICGNQLKAKSYKKHYENFEG